MSAAPPPCNGSWTPALSARSTTSPPVTSAQKLTSQELAPQKESFAQVNSSPAGDHPHGRRRRDDSKRSKTFQRSSSTATLPLMTTGTAPAPLRRSLFPAEHAAPIFLLWLVIFVASLFAPPLLDDADATHAQAARAIASTGDWVTLHVNGIRYLEKPPLPTGSPPSPSASSDTTPSRCIFRSRLPSSRSPASAISGRDAPSIPASRSTPRFPSSPPPASSSSPHLHPGSPLLTLPRLRSVRILRPPAIPGRYPPGFFLTRPHPQQTAHHEQQAAPLPHTPLGLARAGRSHQRPGRAHLLLRSGSGLPGPHPHAHAVATLPPPGRHRPPPRHRRALARPRLHPQPRPRRRPRLRLVLLHQ